MAGKAHKLLTERVTYRKIRSKSGTKEGNPQAPRRDKDVGHSEVAFILLYYS
jgi:hypothetical protein